MPNFLWSVFQWKAPTSVKFTWTGKSPSVSNWNKKVLTMRNWKLSSNEATQIFIRFSYCQCEWLWKAAAHVYTRFIWIWLYCSGITFRNKENNRRDTNKNIRNWKRTWEATEHEPRKKSTDGPKALTGHVHQNDVSLYQVSFPFFSVTGPKKIFRCTKGFNLLYRGSLNRGFFIFIRWSFSDEISACQYQGKKAAVLNRNLKQKKVRQLYM